MDKIVVVYSGGIDSFTMLNKYVEENKMEVHAITFNYNQRHSKEIDYAKKVCDILCINHKIVDVSTINQLLKGSSLTDDISIPEGHYKEESMKSTVVPNRNMIFLSLGAGYGASIGAKYIAIGVHSGDHAIYPDCKPEFIYRMNEVMQISDYNPLRLLTPYLMSSKAYIIKKGLELGLDYANAWTCYNGRENACGKCGSCVERLEAFEKAGMKDPIAYE